MTPQPNPVKKVLMKLSSRIGIRDKSDETVMSASSDSTGNSIQAPLEQTPSTAASVNDQTMASSVRLVDEYYNSINEKGFHNSLHYLNCSQVVFADAVIDWLEFEQEIKNMLSAFPDFHFKKISLTEVKPGVVEVVHQAIATHTGTPYGFGPFPPVETSGKAVKLDPEKCTYEVKDGKVCKFKVEPLGNYLTGPHGMYTSIGGFPVS